MLKGSLQREPGSNQTTVVRCALVITLLLWLSFASGQRSSALEGSVGTFERAACLFEVPGAVCGFVTAPAHGQLGWSWLPIALFPRLVDSVTLVNGCGTGTANAFLDSLSVDTPCAEVFGSDFAANAAIVSLRPLPAARGAMMCAGRRCPPASFNATS